VAVDLPAGDESAGFTAYADTIVAAAGDASDVVLVAQSLGGFSAPLAVDRLDVRRLVMLNAMVPRPGETFSEWWGAVGQGPASRAFAEQEGRDPDAEFDVVEAFFHDVPDDVVADAMSRGEPEQAEKPLDEPWPLDAWPDVETTGVTSRHDRLFPEALQRTYLHDRLGIEPTVIDGGHLVALSNPEGLAEVLLRA
ncbi:MAG TPA: alpha/beta hydrolase, partial [Nocardioides sp.]|nr:alpha/beta hydrolase [Nocardioides sp.]